MILRCLHNLNPRWKYTGEEPDPWVILHRLDTKANREFDSFLCTAVYLVLGARDLGGVTGILAGGYHKF